MLLTDDDFARLRRIAEAANAEGREWEWTGGYPQTILRVGDAAVVANTFEGPDSPTVFAEFIAAFDPPTVLTLMDGLEALSGMLDNPESVERDLER